MGSAAVLVALSLLIGVLYVRGQADAHPSGAVRRPPPSSMAALGDSITAGYNACGQFRDCPDRSWSTGSDESVNSHYLRLLAINPDIEGRAFNYAESGASADDLSAQARLAVAAGVDYVTVLIGANDACRDTEAEMTASTEFRALIDEALGVLRGGLPAVRVFISSIPDVHRLWEVEHDDRLAQLVWFVGGVCQTMLGDPTSNSTDAIARRSRVRNRVVALNEQLRQACAAFGSDCRFDDDAVFDQDFSGAAVSSWDHFHPSGAGQTTLAAVTAEAGFSWR